MSQLDLLHNQLCECVPIAANASEKRYLITQSCISLLIICNCIMRTHHNLGVTVVCLLYDTRVSPPPNSCRTFSAPADYHLTPPPHPNLGPTPVQSTPSSAEALFSTMTEDCQTAIVARSTAPIPSWFDPTAVLQFLRQRIYYRHHPHPHVGNAECKPMRVS